MTVIYQLVNVFFFGYFYLINYLSIYKYIIIQLLYIGNHNILKKCVSCFFYHNYYITLRSQILFV